MLKDAQRCSPGCHLRHTNSHVACNLTTVDLSSFRPCKHPRIMAGSGDGLCSSCWNLLLPAVQQKSWHWIRPWVHARCSEKMVAKQPWKTRRGWFLLGRDPKVDKDTLECLSTQRRPQVERNKLHITTLYTLWRLAFCSFLYDSWESISYVVTFVHNVDMANQGKEASGPKPSDCCEACQLARWPKAQAEDWAALFSGHIKLQLQSVTLSLSSMCSVDCAKVPSKLSYTTALGALGDATSLPLSEGQSVLEARQTQIPSRGPVWGLLVSLLECLFVPKCFNDLEWNVLYQSHAFGMASDDHLTTFLTCLVNHATILFFQCWDCWRQVDVLISTCQTMSK